MKIIIFGLGSMGKRRARCLQTMGYREIFGYDVKAERVNDASTCGIIAKCDLTSLPLAEADVYFICTPPDKHEEGMRLALEYRKPCFVEASVVLGDLEEIDIEAKLSNVLIAPSCTMAFHPAIKLIKEIVQSQKYGKATNFSYHCGQYLPDWHPWENVKDFYVSNYLTGGCREIVPFELTWLIDCFGVPTNGSAFYGKTMDVGAEIPDTYAISLQFPDYFGTLLIDVTSRYAIRSLILNFERAQLHWRWDAQCLNIYDATTKEWHKISFSTRLNNAAGYNENISEDMYVDEISAFLLAAQDKAHFPNTLEKDIAILKILENLEKGKANEILS